MPKFEVAIYNQQVRDLVAEGDSHEYYDDEWADIHFLEVSAENEGLAQVQIDGRHPMKNMLEGCFHVEIVARPEPGL